MKESMNQKPEDEEYEYKYITGNLITDVFIVLCWLLAFVLLSFSTIKTFFALISAISQL